MIVVYVAGPFRAPTRWAVEQNVRRVEEWGLKVAELGAMPLMPHCNTRFFDGLLTDEFWLDGTLELLKRCDTAFMVPGWQASSGARGERQWCIDHALPHFEDLVLLKVWIEIASKVPACASR